LPAALQQRQQSAGEREVAQVICAELQFKAVRGGLPLARRHDAGVVDQKIDGPALRKHAGGESLNRSKAGQVDLFEANVCLRHLPADSPKRIITFLVAAPSKNNLGARFCESECGFVSEATGCASYHSELARLGWNICRVRHKVSSI
jgi:hypothetical protein